MNELIEDHMPCDEKMKDTLYEGWLEGAKEAVDVAVSLDRGGKEHNHNVLEAIRNLAPILKVLQGHVAANND
jgi:hypothetical protein|tara:strand:+ start:297 stop:512 length:216 start_codon:yes stop_codon:yes gene_type:complete